MLSLNSLGHWQPLDNSVPEQKGVGTHLSTTAFQQGQTVTQLHSRLGNVIGSPKFGSSLCVQLRESEGE